MNNEDKARERSGNDLRNRRTAALSLVIAMCGAPAFAADPEPPLGINVLEATFKWRPNYVSDDMLLNADKDPGNWLHYGKAARTISRHVFRSCRRSRART